MSVKLDSAIHRIAQRVVRLQDFLDHCPAAAHATRIEKQAELNDYREALATLIAHRAMMEKAA